MAEIRAVAARHGPFPLKEHLMRAFGIFLSAALALGSLCSPPASPGEEKPLPTRKFEIRNDRPFLGGQQIDLWGLRCGNALMSDAVTERHVNALDNVVAHGINCIGVYVQGSNPGWPDLEASKNGYTPEGALKPAFARRLEWLVREADKRGMVVMVGLFSPRKDQELNGNKAVQRACEETAQLLSGRGLRNVFVDIMHEYNHKRCDLDIFKEPGGAQKKARLTAWFKKHALDVPVGVCPTFKSGTGLSYPGMDVLIVQKDEPIAERGFVVNVETQREDGYDNDGIFGPDARKRMQATWEKFRARPNAFLLFHSGFCQGITNRSGTAPHPEMGGTGTGPDDRGIRFYYEWVKENIGPYKYPKHARGRK
jgi:hypothetical protein